VNDRGEASRRRVAHVRRARAVIDETAAAIERKPLPYVLERHGLRITFKDIWSGFELNHHDTGPAAPMRAG
jgi:hypothetical protein